MIEMTNNEVLKKLRVALALRDDDMFPIFGLAGHEINKAQLSGMFRKKGHKNYIECTDEMLTAFLDGYIIYRRGRKEESAP
jgi:uncharacterized protein YehS (DUF1456 family)